VFLAQPAAKADNNNISSYMLLRG